MSEEFTELIDFKSQMICPACDCRLWHHIGEGPNWNYFPECFPKACSGKKGLFVVKCTRIYPHLHWKCKVCGCKFVSETKLGQVRMKQISG